MEALGIIMFVLVVWLLPIYVAGQMGKPKNRAGYAWGVFLGWVGVICLALLPPLSGDAAKHRTFRLSR